MHNMNHCEIVLQLTRQQVLTTRRSIETSCNVASWWTLQKLRPRKWLCCVLRWNVCAWEHSQLSYRLNARQQTSGTHHKTMMRSLILMSWWFRNGRDVVCLWINSCVNCNKGMLHWMRLCRYNKIMDTLFYGLLFYM